MSNSPLVQYTLISPNSHNPRNKPISKITIHHMAGVCSAETCGNIFQPVSRDASSNYGIGYDGKIGMYCEEKNRSWCSSSPTNDHQAITIEVSNSASGGNWPVSDLVLNRVIELCIDICKRNPGIKQKNGKPGLYYDETPNGSLTRHNMFASTACPGPYLQSKFPYIVEKVNEAFNKPIQPTYNLEKITPKTIYFLKDANMYDLSFKNWDEVKIVKTFKKGESLEVSSIATHILGSKYYLSTWSTNNNIGNGFNIVDCSDNKPTEEPKPPIENPKEEPIEKPKEEPIEEPIEESKPIEPPQEQETPEKEENDKDNTNAPTDTETPEKEQINDDTRPDLIKLIIKLFKKLFNLIFKGGNNGKV